MLLPHLKYLIFICLCYCCIAKVDAQSTVPSISSLMKSSTEKSKIKHYLISGNKRTKDFVIARELGIEGDSLPVSNIAATLERIKINLMNTKLFNAVQVNIKNWDEEGLDLDIQVVEKWYIIPIPIFQLADRNVNEWWVDGKRDFRRLQYGMAVNWRNFRGRNETMNISASLGFAQLLGVDYLLPKLSKNGKVGASFNLHMMRSKRMPYETSRDKLKFIFEDKVVTRSIDFSSRVIVHRNIDFQQYVEAGFSHRWIDTSITRLNPDYFLENRQVQNAFSLEYGFDVDKRVLKAYPTSGYQVSGNIVNYGLGLQRNVNLTTLSISGSKFFTLDKSGRHSTGHYLKLKASFPSNQPYNLQKGLGYGQDLVRGYEYFVVDGQSYALFKNEYRYHLAALKLGNNPRKNKPLLRQSLPFDFYVKAFLDVGYVKDRFFAQDNTLQNQFLIGGGVGIDMLLMYDALLRFEGSINRNKKVGFYIHFGLPF